jgi:hypothetical protein
MSDGQTTKVDDASVGPLCGEFERLSSLFECAYRFDDHGGIWPGRALPVQDSPVAEVQFCAQHHQTAPTPAE